LRTKETEKAEIFCFGNFLFTIKIYYNHCGATRISPNKKNLKIGTLANWYQSLSYCVLERWRW